MLPLLLDLPSYYKFHKVEKLWRVKTRVFSYIRVKKIMFYTEFVTHQVDFAYFFHLFCSWKQTTKSIFLVQIIVQKIVWGLLWFFFNDFSNENYSSTYMYFFFKPKNWVVYLIPLELPSVNDGAFAIFFVFGCVRVRNCFSLYFTALQ